MLYLYFISAKIAGLRRGIVSAHLRTLDSGSIEASLQRRVRPDAGDFPEVGPCPMVSEQGRCRVHMELEQLEVDLLYHAGSASWLPAGQAPILSKGNRHLTWAVPFPSAGVSGVVQANGREWAVFGAGYQDVVEMSITPWQLPVNELIWGRAHCENRTVVFNQVSMREGTILQYVLIRRGGDDPDPLILRSMAIDAGQLDHEMELRCADATLRLSLDCVLRVGEIAAGGQIRSRLLGKMLSGISGRPFEKKMLSKADRNPTWRTMHDIALWNLERRGSLLYWGGCSLSDLARAHGTPLYVVNPGLVTGRYEGFLRLFQAAGLNAKVFFSYKTNPVPAVLKPLAALGCGAEVISEFEFWLADRLSIDGAGIIVNGSVKSQDLLRQAVEKEVTLINVETVEEMLRLRQFASARKRTANVGLRINPCLAKGSWDFTLTAGSKKSHIGFRKGDAAWGEALAILREDPALRLRGLHFHIGSGILSVRPYEAALRVVLEMWRELLERDFIPRFLTSAAGSERPL